MNETPTATTRHVRDPSGNRRLLAGAGIALLILLAIEYLTLLLGLHNGWIGTHVYVGLVLVPVAAYKLAVAAYRFTRYYTHDPDYRRAGPPQLLLRLVAPVLAISTVTLLGSGILLVTGHHADRRTINAVHQASYVVLSIAVGVHVLAYSIRAFRGFVADLQESSRRSLLRIAVLCLAVVAGIGFAHALPHRSGDDDGGRFERSEIDDHGGLRDGDQIRKGEDLRIF